VDPKEWYRDCNLDCRLPSFDYSPVGDGGDGDVRQGNVEFCLVAVETNTSDCIAELRRVGNLRKRDRRLDGTLLASRECEVLAHIEIDECSNVVPERVASEFAVRVVEDGPELGPSRRSERFRRRAVCGASGAISDDGLNVRFGLFEGELCVGIRLWVVLCRRIADDKHAGNQKYDADDSERNPPS
jgi:hypothetical protein